MDDDQSAATSAKFEKLPASMQALVDRLHDTGKAETVFGLSREEHGRTIVPVARVSYGFGGGFGVAGAKKKRGKAVEQYSTDGEPHADEGAGGGGGVNVMPIGAFEVTDSGVQFVPVAKSTVGTAGILLAGVLTGVAIGRATCKASTTASPWYIRWLRR